MKVELSPVRTGKAKILFQNNVSGHNSLHGGDIFKIFDIVPKDINAIVQTVQWRNWRFVLGGAKHSWKGPTSQFSEKKLRKDSEPNVVDICIS